MKLSILTLFPEFFISSLEVSIIGRAKKTGLVDIQVINIRDFAQDKHRTTDDRPFGGGSGMVMKIEPINLALKSLNLDRLDKSDVKIILTSAKGKLFNQGKAENYSKLKHLVIICGHYEGVDERVSQNLIDEEIRIGDFVLTGGEVACSVMIDSVVRLIPGVLGNPESLEGESHSQQGIMGYPQYTRPEDYEGLKVPEVLLSGNHRQITNWREQNRSK